MSKVLKTINGIETFEKLEDVYSYLRKDVKYKEKKIEIVYNQETKEYIIEIYNEKETNYDKEIDINVDMEVVYGDSVTGDTPLLLRKNNMIYIENISKLFKENEKIDYPGFKIFDKEVRLEKEYSLSDYEIWSDGGWVKINKVIRHKCEKKIYRVLTHTGYVKVTEDHSLLNAKNEIVKPSECNLETELLTSYPKEFNNSIETISEDRAIIYGFFYGDGSCDKYNCNSGIKYSWTLNNSDMNIINYLKELLIREYPDNYPVVYDTLKSSGVYKLTVKNPKIFIEEYRNKFYDENRCKKIPVDILNSTDNIISSFFKGYWMADGCRKDKENIGCTRFDNKGQIGSAGLYFLMKKLGYNVSLNTRVDKENIFRLTITEKNQRRVANKIKKISIDTNKQDYVYDIETENGHFQAGIGDIIVKNTDSIMIRMKYNRDDFIQNRKDSFKLGEECARILTDDIFNRKPIEMEAENIYNPFIMLTRKRYTAKKYEDPDNVLKTKGIITKGLATTRRDYSPMIQKCLKSIIEEIMKTEGKPSMKQKVIKDSINIYLETLENIKNNKIPLVDIITSATLKKTYKNENLPHVNLYKKLKDRKEEVQIGDRIQFVFIEDPTNTKAKNELAEDPKYVERNGLNINRYFYTEKLAKVILGFYKSILTQEQLNEILEITNTYIESYSGKCLKEKDFEVD